MPNWNKCDPDDNYGPPLKAVRHNPFGAWQSPLSLADDRRQEIAPAKKTDLTLPVPAAAERRSVADIIGVPKLTFLRPIGEDYKTAAEATYAPLPQLTRPAVNQLMLWKLEYHGGRLPDGSCTSDVVVKTGPGKWQSTGKTWKDIGRMMAAGEGAPDTNFATLEDYVEANKPPLTASSLKKLLSQTQEFYGRTIAHNDTLWMKEDTGSDVKWIPSLHTMRSVNMEIGKNPHEFGSETLASFRRKNGFPARRTDSADTAARNWARS